MLKNLFKRNSGINQYKLLVNQINALEKNLKGLTDTELRDQTFCLKEHHRLTSSNRNIFSFVRLLVCQNTLVSSETTRQTFEQKLKYYRGRFLICIIFCFM